MIIIIVHLLPGLMISGLLLEDISNSKMKSREYFLYRRNESHTTPYISMEPSFRSPPSLKELEVAREYIQNYYSSLYISQRFFEEEKLLPRKISVHAPRRFSFSNDYGPASPLKAQRSLKTIDDSLRNPQASSQVPAVVSTSVTTSSEEFKIEYLLNQMGAYSTVENLATVSAESSEHRNRIYAFLALPAQFEKFLGFGFFVCLDSFLFLLTYLPMRLVFMITRGFLFSFACFPPSVQSFKLSEEAFLIEISVI